MSSLSHIKKDKWLYFASRELSLLFLSLVAGSHKATLPQLGLKIFMAGFANKAHLCSQKSMIKSFRTEKKLHSAKDSLINKIKKSPQFLKILEKEAAKQAQAIKILEKTPKSKIEKILAQYQKDWSQSFLNYGSQRLSSISEIASFFQKLQKNIAEEKKIIKDAAQKRKQKSQLLKTLEPKQRQLIELLDTLYELRDQRKFFLLETIVPIKSYLKKMAGKYHFSYQDIRWLTWQEHSLPWRKQSPSCAKKDFQK